MDSSPEGIVRQEIDFKEGRRAQMVMPPVHADPADIAHALGLEQPDALMLIFGGADGMEADAQTRIARLFRESLVPVAIARRALIIDGGTQSGIMQILGNVIAERQDSPCALGVAPIEKVTYPGKTETADGGERAALDPNHSHFILTPTSEWGSETETIFDMTALLSDCVAESVEARSRVVALLANGGGIAKEEAYRCAWQGWNLVILAGTGRVADEIADAHALLPALPADPKIRDIITRSTVFVFPIEAEPAALTQLLESLET